MQPSKGQLQGMVVLVVSKNGGYQKMAILYLYKS
jgi:hypothetical protein